MHSLQQAASKAGISTGLLHLWVRKAVASYMGMIPREHSSGGRQLLGAMSKQGNTLLRYLWCEAAMHAVDKFQPTTHTQPFATQAIAKRGRS